MNDDGSLLAVKGQEFDNTMYVILDLVEFYDYMCFLTKCS